MENREKKLIGKGITQEVSEAFEAHIEESRKESQEPMEGEIEKTEEQLEKIRFLRGVLEKELAELKITEIPEFHPERIHFIKREVFDKLCSEVNELCNFRSDGFYNRPADNIVLACENDPTPQIYKNLLHEMIHQLSYYKYRMEKEPEPAITRYREGFSINEQELFDALEEAVTELTTIKLLFKKYEKEFRDKFNLKPEEMDSIDHCYVDYIDVLQSIIEKMAEASGEDEESVWLKFESATFTGKLMFLRPIERIYGKGSLRLLASLGIESEPETAEMIIKYFTTATPEERLEILKNIPQGEEEAA